MSKCLGMYLLLACSFAMPMSGCADDKLLPKEGGFRGDGSSSSAATQQTIDIDGVSIPAGGNADTTVTLTEISINPKGPKLVLGETLKLSAQGHYSDGSTKDITDKVSWTSSADNIVTVGTSGEASTISGQDTGVATVTAKLSSISGNTQVSVSLKELYLLFTASGNFDLTLNEIVSDPHDFSDFNFRTTPFKLYVSDRLLSRIDYGGVTGYQSTDISYSIEPNTKVTLHGIQRSVTERTAADNLANSRCIPVADNVFSQEIIDRSVVLGGGDTLDLSNQTGVTYIFKDEKRDRWADNDQGCYPSVHSSRKSTFAAPVAAPTFVGGAWADDGYSNTYSNGAYVYVDQNGNLHLRYQSDTSQSRAVFMLGLISHTK